MKTAKSHLKKKTHFNYHKRVEPDLNQPQALVSSDTWIKKLQKRFKSPLVLISALVAIVAIILTLVLLFSRQQQKPPSQTALKPTTTPQPSPLYPPPTKYQKGPFLCPGILEFCQEGKDVFIGKTYIGFGGKLLPNSPIYASFDGEASSSALTIAASPTSKKVQKITALILTDQANLLRAVYYFTGTAIKNHPVKQGEVIATANAEPMPLYNQSSLVFVLTRNYAIKDKRLGGERVRLKKEDFKFK